MLPITIHLLPLEVGCSQNKHLNTYSKVQWVHSVYPSDWGWYADISKILVWQNIPQCWPEVCCEVWIMIVQNRLWNSKHMYNGIKEQSNKLCGAQLPLPMKQGVKQTYFLNFSMQVKTAFQSATTGRLVTKSIDHTSNQLVGMGTGFNNPWGAVVRPLLC